MAAITSGGARAALVCGYSNEIPRSAGGSHVRNGSGNRNRFKRVSRRSSLKCAVKDDDTLIDAIVEKLYGTMKGFDAERAKQAIELIVDRDTTAASKFRALLDDLLLRRPSDLAA